MSKRRKIVQAAFSEHEFPIEWMEQGQAQGNARDA